MLYDVAKSIARPITQAVYRPDVEGIENIPRSGPVIIASNHLSFSDSFFIPVVLPRPMTFIAKAEYFTKTGITGRFSKWFYTSFNAVPVDRSGSRDATRAALEVAVQSLDRGELFGIYPEGTRSPDGRLYRGRTGIAEIALRTGAPIIPTGIIGTDQIQPPGASMWHLGKPVIKFGKALDLTAAKELGKPALVRRAITDQVIEEIQKLTGQEYVHLYASDAKDGSAASAAKA